MKTSKLSILASLLLAANAAMACGPWYFSAADNRIYHLLPPLWQSASTVQEDFATKNILLWAEQSGCDDTAAIRSAIYGSSLADWEAIHDNTSTTTNSFVAHLQRAGDRDAIELLYQSKRYESIRNAQRSPWYYNSSLDNDEKQELRWLQDDLQRHQPFKGKYADRYRFLAIKCAWAAGKDSLVAKLWESEQRHLKESLFYIEAEDYVARSLVRQGHDREAEAIYRRHGDLGSLIPAGLPLHAKLRLVLQHVPNSPEVAPMLQEYLSTLDRYQASEYLRWHKEDMDPDSMLAVARQAIAHPKVKNKAQWRYAAACILDFTGEPRKALEMLRGCTTEEPHLKRSIRILRFHLRAQTEHIDKNLVQYAVGETQWLVGEMQREWTRLPECLQQEIAQAVCWRYSMSSLNKLQAYSSLRRILLTDSTGLAWRMARAGHGVRALQMANVAENHFVQLSLNTVIPYQRSSFGAVNEHDYSNGMFAMADRMKARTLEAYYRRIRQPQDEVDRWMNRRGYTDPDYWLDIVGTHYLRESNYRAAARCLSRVSASYQQRMNIEFSISPFSLDRSIRNLDSTHYKLQFAQGMDSLERAMQRGDSDSRGLAMLEYTIGLENSFDMCWWLTSYQKGWTGANLIDIEMSDYARNARLRCDRLRQKALLTLCSREGMAKYYARLGMLTKVMKEYGETATAQHYALVCDQWRDYRL